MKKMLLSLLFAVALIFVGCEEQKSSEKSGADKKEAKKEAAKEITIENIGSFEFAEIDENEDGRFTYDEFDKITKNKGSAEGNTVYAEYDVDGNGIISEKEFSKK